MTDSDIRVARHLPAALAYHVLAHVDLGRDAANLYDKALPRRAFVPPLTAAYAAAPGRLSLQFVGLYGGDIDLLIERLEQDRVRPLRDAPGRHLARAFAAALVFAREPFERTFAEDQTVHGARAKAFFPYLDSLARCRTEIHKISPCTGGPPPPLSILDCPALGRHGRAMAFRDGTRAVAVSLGRPPDDAFCQVLHEETHPVSDPTAGLSAEEAAARDTRTDAPGFAAHRRVEDAAVRLGRDVIAAAAPDLAASYERWVRRLA